MDPETFKDELDKRKLLASLQDELHKEIPVEPGQLDNAWRALARAMFARPDGRPQFERHERVGRGMGNVVRPQRWTWIAQGIGGVVAACLLFAISWHHMPSGHSPSVGITRTYATRAGQSAAITLDDGTRVVLAQQSILRLVHFGSARRSVHLDGEAYFDIAQASGAPFTVQTGGVSTRVLGTAFLMRHYDGERVVRVSVAAGKVSVMMHDRSAPSVLVAGDVGEVGDSTITFHAVRQLDADAEWIGGRLFFNDVPVQEVLATLTRWYGYQFQYSDSAIASQNVTVWLSTRSSADALATLERLLNISATVTKDTVTLTLRHGADRPRMQRKGSYDVWTPTREVGR